MCSLPGEWTEVVSSLEVPEEFSSGFLQMVPTELQVIWVSDFFYDTWERSNWVKEKIVQSLFRYYGVEPAAGVGFAYAWVRVVVGRECSENIVNKSTTIRVWPLCLWKYQERHWYASSGVTLFPNLVNNFKTAELFSFMLTALVLCRIVFYPEYQCRLWSSRIPSSSLWFWYICCSV